MIIELEIFIFGCSAIAYIQSISKDVSEMKADMASVRTQIALCPNCPHAKGA